MLFNSIDFVIFFLTVTVLYFGLPHKYRWLLLLLASCYFYMAFIPIYILVLFLTILIDYWAGIFIEKAKTQRKKKILLIVSLFGNLGVLFFFKYYNFFIENVNQLFELTNSGYSYDLLTFILPVGLSFHTFQAMSYTIEVYKGNQKAEKHIGIYALYVMYYPQLVAGPIERPQNLFWQFYKEHNFEYSRVASGLRQMLWGLFKKVVIADRLALYVGSVYGDVDSYQGFPLIIATYFFAIQIYCDFSGYTDIALGASKVMGIDLMKNFRTPYLATSIKGFWSRWHISLSTWFKDYVYIPLGGNRVPEYRVYFNLFIVFLLSGLWHGASWNFVIWGALHGLYLIIGVMIAPYLNRIPSKGFFFSMISWFVTFNLVTFAWIFFRSESFSDTIYILSNIWKVDTSVLFGVPIYSTYFNVLCVLFILIIFLSDIFSEAFEKNAFLNRTAFLYGRTLVQVILIFTFGIFENQQFIYFQF